jgi:predicted  nucleic acid-binding Zn-ribbon protein
MSNRLNYSSIDDVWGKNINNIDDNLHQKFNYKKPVENTLSINDNQINELKDEIQRLKNRQEHFAQETIKPCSLIDEHIKKCSICRKKILQEYSHQEHFNNKVIENYEDNPEEYNYDEEVQNIMETFENITPSQKNLLLVIIYGVLIIVISDLVIKDTK